MTVVDVRLVVLKVPTAFFYSRLKNMSFEQKMHSFFESTITGLNRMTQMNDEVFGTSDKTEYDCETLQLFTYADITYKICANLKDQMEAMITPNAARRIAKRVGGGFSLLPSMHLQRSEKLAKIIAGCAAELPGTDLSVTLSHCVSAYLCLGQSEREFAMDVHSELLLVIKDFLTSYWPEVQKERRKLDLLRIDYDWARRKKWKKVDEKKVAMMKQDFDRQLYLTQLLLQQCKTTREKIASGLVSMATAQLQHFKRCDNSMALNPHRRPTFPPSSFPCISLFYPLPKKALSPINVRIVFLKLD
ncbi:SH3 domain GRB2 endophilin B2 [Echinococcus multilocularis]|uniref:SH3 domain GRB2 endophilin B2 n=1 Tax=Echinococcus multilocularis TaxID=6211 RepID=A0A068Y4T0_ECHMU|nr:SH3 domain GRB2 endophilin B2 [Echinococcus multilocularis]